MIKISVFSDFACPYCYIGEMRLMNAIRSLGLTDRVQVEFKAFELDPHVPKTVVTNNTERLMQKYRFPEDVAKSQINQINQLGRDMGLDMNYQDARYSNTRDAHRLMKLAEDQETAEVVYKLNFALFDAYFNRAEVLADHKVLSKIAAEAGMDMAKVVMMLESDQYEKEVLADEHEAENHGIKSIPYFIFNGESRVPGAVAEDDFKHLLTREVEKKDAKNITLGKPHACNSKSCDLV